MKTLLLTIMACMAISFTYAQSYSYKTDWQGNTIAVDQSGNTVAIQKTDWQGDTYFQPATNGW